MRRDRGDIVLVGLADGMQRPKRFRHCSKLLRAWAQLVARWLIAIQLEGGEEADGEASISASAALCAAALWLDCGKSRGTVVDERDQESESEYS